MYSVTFVCLMLKRNAKKEKGEGGRMKEFKIKYEKKRKLKKRKKQTKNLLKKQQQKTRNK